MANARSLGEGKIIKLLKKYAFIQDDKLGRIYFPLDALLEECRDLREKFTENEAVIYTAQRQVPAYNDCNFIASSVTRKKELATLCGFLSDVFEKYAYADVPKHGKVFIPFSARNEFNKPWLGRGAAVGVRCTLKVLRQPEFHKCQYVAFAVYLGDARQQADEFLNGALDPQLQRQMLSRIERQPDVAHMQVGIIVIYAGPDKDAYAYSAQTGLTRVLHSDLTSSITLGTCLQYDVCKSVDLEQPKCAWKAENIRLVKPFVTALSEKNDAKKLTIETLAIVCRSSLTNRAAWLWNDYIGRLYVNNHSYASRLRPFAVVHVRAQYTGSFEDVPWSAMEVEVIGDNVEDRNSYGQLLVTDDNWKVNYVSEQTTGTFFGFLENEIFGSAFFAWTDMAEQDTPPRIGSICRVTAYKQFRDRKHNWRAVLVSLCDENNEPICYHPFITNSGELRAPTPLSTSSNGSSLVCIPEKISTPASTVSTATSSENGRIYSNYWSSSDVSEYTFDMNNEFDRGHKSCISRTMSIQESPTSPLEKAKPSTSVADIWGYDPFGFAPATFSEDLQRERPREWLLSDLFYSGSEGHLKKSENVPLVVTQQAPIGTLPFSVSKTTKVMDAMTQTESFFERELLKDILSNKDLFVQVLAAFPEQAKNIIGINWRG